MGVAAAGCGNSHKDYEQAMVAIAATEAALIRGGICKSPADCTTKKLVFFEAGRGVDINVYSLSDLDTANAIFLSLCELHNENLFIDYRINVFSSARDAGKKLIFARREYRSSEKCQ